MEQTCSVGVSEATCWASTVCWFALPYLFVPAQNSHRHPFCTDGLFEFGELDAEPCAKFSLQQPAVAPAMPPAMLPSESLTLVPYGPHTLAIPTSMVTPELLASLSGATVQKQPCCTDATPTVTATTDASHATVHNPPRESRLKALGKELNALLSDDQRVLLNQLHREASDAADTTSAACAKQRFWDVWYAAAPRDKVDELRVLMQEPPATPISATPAASVDNNHDVSGVGQRHAAAAKPASVSGASCALSSCQGGDDEAEGVRVDKRKRSENDDVVERTVMPRWEVAA